MDQTRCIAQMAQCDSFVGVAVSNDRPTNALLYLSVWEVEVGATAADEAGVTELLTDVCAASIDKSLSGRVTFEHIMTATQDGLRGKAWPAMEAESLNPTSRPFFEWVFPRKWPQLPRSKILSQVSGPTSAPANLITG